MKEQTTKTAATINIINPSDMTAKGRKEIAAWLKRQAQHLEKHGDQYAKRFRARYLYT